MADEFNLSPTNNTEKFLDDILRTAQGEQAQFNLVPNWRIEQYLEAIKNALAAGSNSGGTQICLIDLEKDGQVVWEDIGSCYRAVFQGYTHGADTSLPIFARVTFDFDSVLLHEVKRVATSPTKIEVAVTNYYGENDSHVTGVITINGHMLEAELYGFVV